ncbi:hypothetical protein IRJ41_022192 [Triplophysa rosa]|uniref:Uncharacterized protein n=1 Tax=Triplophysa rosa TaxID=992332 RepID=A0A9W8CA09_TRIRA|nr:hypothetical protein IRJ41_022192 [Triplophysa rosa]
MIQGKSRKIYQPNSFHLTETEICFKGGESEKQLILSTFSFDEFARFREPTFSPFMKYLTSYRSVQSGGHNDIIGLGDST